MAPRGCVVTERLFTTAEKLACVQREIGQRQRVYPGLVERQRMSQAKADREIACMRAIEADLQKQVLAEDEDLFSRGGP